MRPIVQDVDFLFIYEVRNREIDSICLLGAWLEEQGYTVAYINSWDTMYHWNPEYRAKVAVLSACYTDGAYAFFTGYALRFDKVVNLQWEQVLMNAVSHSSGQTDWDFKGKIPWETRHVCWGENNRRYLIDKYGMAEDHLRVCGYLPLDFYREEFRDTIADKGALFARYGLDPDRKTLLFISSFAEVGKPEAEAAEIQDEGADSRTHVELQETSQQMILDWFRQLARDEQGIQIIYRPHPSEANNPKILACAGEIPGFHVIAEESIRNWIRNCDVLCNWKSTSMIELYAAGKKTLILHPKPIPFAFSMPFFEEGHYTAVTTYEALLAGVRDRDAAFPIEKDFLLQFYSITEQPAYERTGQYLIDTLKDPDYHSRDEGNHLTAKGRMLDRVRNRAILRKAKILHAVARPAGKTTPRAQAIEKTYAEQCYYEQRILQNRMPYRELRGKIDGYRRMMRSAR